MEKRISFFEYQNAVSVAKIIDPLLREMKKAQEQYDKLNEQYAKIVAKMTETTDEIAKYEDEIKKYQSGIVKYIGFPVTDIVQKVMVPTGKTTPEGKPAMTAEYKPTANVRFDEATKEYVITMPDTEEDYSQRNTATVPSESSEGEAINPENYNND